MSLTLPTGAMPMVVFDACGSISTERALKQIQDLLLSHSGWEGPDALQDKLNASLDDVETMLKAIYRGAACG